MKYLSILLLLIIRISCKSRTEAEIYTESYIEQGAEGTVLRTELWKGGLLKVFIQNLVNKEEIVGVFNDYDILIQIQPHDYFKKFEGSNKAFIKRKDSIFYFDNVFLEKLNEDAAEILSDIEQWDRQNINKWKKIQ